jgi:hypothetical protein
MVFEIPLCASTSNYWNTNYIQNTTWWCWWQ